MERDNDLLFYTAEVHTAVHKRVTAEDQSAPAPQNPWGPGVWNIVQHIDQKNFFKTNI